MLLTYIVPIAIGLKIISEKSYYEFIEGKNSNPLMTMYKNSDVGEKLLTKLINIEESYNDAKEKKQVTAEEKLQTLYNAIFVDEYGRHTGNYFIKIGRYEIDEKSKSLVKTAASMLSDYANFEVR